MVLKSQNFWLGVTWGCILLCALFCALVFLCGCASQGITKWGTHWYGDNHYVTLKIERQIELTAHAFEQTTGYEITNRNIKKLQAIHFHSTPSLSVNGTKCQGYITHTPRVIHVVDRYCVAMGSFVHELIHHFAWETYGHPDYDHKNTKLFCKQGENCAVWLAIAAGQHENLCQ